MEKVVFAASEEVSLSHLNALIQSKLIDATWFHAEQWQLPDLHFKLRCDETDHTFHDLNISN
ncbi:hypothetical protein ABDD95_00385 [Mucilaginibacter sp. PAMB04274]|uniref:hypothetical protein n=1 Tax=Mucilaginibacter sp. PAMB04274 TaxID=3138568 RepID=UPI0031F6B2F7